MKRILVVIDMQNDFINGSLGSSDAEAVVAPTVRKIREYASDPEASVFATMDSHGEDYLQTAEGKGLPVPHCVKGTYGWELHPDVKDALPKEAVVVGKPTFGSYALVSALIGKASEKGGADLDVEIVGLCTDVCVISNALMIKAALPEARIRVCPDCCAGTSKEAHEAALTAMRSCQIGVADADA